MMEIASACKRYESAISRIASGRWTKTSDQYVPGREVRVTDLGRKRTARRFSMNAVEAGCHSTSNLGALNGEVRGAPSGEDFAALAICTQVTPSAQNGRCTRQST